MPIITGCEFTHVMVRIGCIAVAAVETIAIADAGNLSYTFELIDF
jgi:hypothetical protein